MPITGGVKNEYGNDDWKKPGGVNTGRWVTVKDPRTGQDVQRWEWFGSEGTGMNWGAIIAALVGAGANAYSAKQAQKSHEGGSGFTNEPWGPTQPMIMDLLNRALGLSNQPMPAFPGGPRNVGINPQLQKAMDLIAQRTGDTTHLDNSNTLGNAITSGTHNPIINHLFSGGGGNIENPYMDEFINRGFAGDFENDLLKNFLTSGLGGMMGGGLTGGGSSFGGGGNFDFQGIEPNQWMLDVLNGKWLNNNPHLARVADNIRREGIETYSQSVVPQIDSQYARAGRFGSGHYGTAQALANEEANEAIGDDISQLYSQDYTNERSNMMGAMGILSGQDIANLNAQTSMYNANTAAGASAYNSDLASQDRRLGLMLEGLLGHGNQKLGGLGLLGDMIGAYSQDRTNELGVQRDLAGMLSNDMLGYLSAIPGLEGAKYIGPELMFQGGQEMQRNAQGNANRRHAYDMQKWQYETQYPYKQLEFFANLLYPAAGMGGSGTSFSPYTGQNPWEAALTGALGGWMFGQGMGNNGGGNNGGNSNSGNTGLGFDLDDWWFQTYG